MIQRRDEEGSALMLALVMITVIGVMLAGALSFVDTSVIATPVLEQHRDESNAVDGAVEGAINAVRGSGTLGIENAPIDCDFPDPDPSDDVDVTVECTPQAGSGSAFDDQPLFAITTLGSAPGEGFFQQGNNTLTVDGGLYSNGELDLTKNGAQSAMLSYGDVFVEGDCDPDPGDLFSSVGGLIECDYAGDSRGDDPNYPSGAANASAMAVDPAATCVSTNSVVAFSPGLYTEIPAAPSTCKGSVWWFQPGVYYFDFPDITGRHTWTPDDLDGKTVVGGTPKTGWSASTNASAISVPGACDTTKDGVQFIFGGPSLLNITSQGTVELCGGTNATNHNNHKIVFYGLKSEPARTSVGPSTLAQTGTPVSPGPTAERTFLLANPNGKTIDGLVAAATLSTSGNSNDEADITLPVFADVPDGARITSVKLKTRHFEAINQMDATAHITLPDGTTDSKALSNFTAATCTATTACVDTWDITSHFDDAYDYDQLNGLSARFHAKVRGNNPTGSLVSFDGMELEVTYVPVGFEQHRCPTGVSNCSVISSTVDQNLFFHGTVYVPSGGLNLRVHGKQKTIFDRGVVARTMTVDVSASSTQVESPFQIPQATTGRSVLFVAKVDGADRLRALVSFQDFNVVSGANTAFPGYRVEVEKWSVIR